MSATSKGAITLRNQIHSPLLRLPAEIRNEIYHSVLGGREIYICSEWICSVQRNLAAAVHAHFPEQLLRLFEVCQQIYVEARLMVFNLNPLYATSLASLHDFLSKGRLYWDQKLAITRLNFNDSIAHRCSGEECKESSINDRTRGNMQCFNRLAGLETVTLELRLFNFNTAQPVLAECAAKVKQEMEHALEQEGRIVEVKLWGQI